MAILPLSGLPAALRGPGGVLDQLQAGQTLRGRVVAGQAGGSTVLVGGVRLAVPGTLPEGATVAIRLAGEQIEVIPRPTTGTASASPGEALTPAAEAATPAARALLAAGLPVHEGLLRQLEALLGTIRPEQLPALAYALAQRLPISAQLLENLSLILRNQARLGDSLATVLGYLEGPQGMALAAALPAGLAEALRAAVERQLRAWERHATGQAGSLLEALRQSGGGLEALLASLAGDAELGALDELKLLFLRLREALRQRPADGTAILAKAVEDALDAMEQQRLASRADGPEAHRWFVQLPLLDGDRPRTADLWIRRESPGDNASDERALYAITVVLHLSRLGGVRIDARYERPHVDLEIRVEREETLPLFQEGHAELARAFDDAGLVLRRYDCMRVAEVQPLRLEDVLPELRVPTGGAIDTTA